VLELETVVVGERILSVVVRRSSFRLNERDEYDEEEKSSREKKQPVHHD
jgi:hypothetical protein